MSDINQSSEEGVYLQLGEAAAEIERAFENGEQPDFDALAARYPGKLNELRELASTIEALHTFEITERSTDSEQKAIHGRELGDFRLIREIGRGGMGVVYDAQQLSLDRRVAVKILPLAGLLDKRQLERFRNEARAAAMLRHPNIVSVHTVGCERGVHFYAMSLIEGRSLADVIEADKKPKNTTTDAQDAETAPVAGCTTASLSSQSNSASRPRFRGIVELVQQAAKALHYAHEEGILHRDIKPSNLLLDHEGSVHVTDFGLARILTADNLTMTGDVVGTLRYMSPEQVEGGSTDPRCDVYALGLVFYELLVGEPAFPAQKRAVLIRQIVEDEVSPPSRKNRNIPADLDRIVLKATAKSAPERYATAEDFADDLSRYLDGRPVKARKLTTLHRAWRWSLRNRSKAALIGIIATFLLAFGIGGSLVAVSYSRLAEKQAHELYERQMASAHQLIKDGHVERAAEILRKYRPRQGERDYRSFEWFEMVRRCRRRLESKTFRTVFPNSSIATSSAGEILVGSRVNGVTVIDAATGKHISSTPSNDPTWAYVQGACFTEDEHAYVVACGTFLVVMSKDSGRPLIPPIDLGARPSSLAATKNGMIAVGLGGLQFKLRESATPEAERKTTIALFQVDKQGSGYSAERIGELVNVPGDAHAIAFSPNGESLAVAGLDGVVSVWDVETKIPSTLPQSRDQFTVDLVFSPSGDRVCGAGGRFETGRWLSGEITIWDIRTDTVVRRIVHEDAFYAAAFTSGSVLAAGTRSGKLVFLDVESGQEIETINAHADLITDLAVTDDGKSIVSSSEDNFVRVWSLPQRRDISVLEDHGEMLDIIGIDIDSEGKQLASASADGEIRLWNIVDGSVNRIGNHKVMFGNAAAFSPDGKRLATLGAEYLHSGRTEVCLWDLADTSSGPEKTIKRYNSGRNCEFSPNGKHLAIVNYAGPRGLALWNVETGRIDRHTKLSWGYRVAFSRDGKHLATPSGVWTYPDLKLVHQHGSEPAFAVAFHPNNDTYAYGHDSLNGFVVTSIRDRFKPQRFAIGEIILHLEFSHDGKRIFAATQHGDVIVWNLETRREILRYRDHDNWVWCLALSNDDKTLASSSAGSKRSSPKISLHRAISDEEARKLLEKR